MLDAHTQSPVSGVELFAFLGLDFGTSSTKMVMRFPYEPGEPSIAIPAPTALRSGDHPYLWQTVVWKRDGRYFPWPEAGSDILYRLKQGLLQPTNDARKTADANAVAYLAFAIRYAKGWVLRQRRNLFVGRKPIWHVNVGMPAGSLDDSVLRPRFQSVVATAFGLDDGSITESQVRRGLEEASVEACSTDEFAARGLAVIPEAAAAMTGFAKSLSSAPGLYLLVDVGALTLDVSMFRLNQGEEGDRYSFMAANVRPLGVESIEWFKTAGRSEADCDRECRKSLDDVIVYTKTKRDPEAAVWSGAPLPVLLTGGGAANKLHFDAVLSFDEGFKQSHYRTDGIRFIDVPAPSSIDWPEAHEGIARLGVAWGLSNPPEEIGKIHPMSAVDDVRAQVQRESARFVSKDDV